MSGATSEAGPTARSLRTRRDVVAAAIEVWAVDNGASLGQVAARAGVGRTTVHRHFPDRGSLVEAVDLACRERFAQAVDRADLLAGTGADALARLMRELVRLESLLALVFADTPVVDLESWETGGRRDPFAYVVERGRADASLTTAVSADWLVVQCWASLFGASLALRDGVPAHVATDQLLRTLLGGVAGPADPV